MSSLLRKHLIVCCCLKRSLLDITRPLCSKRSSAILQHNGKRSHWFGLSYLEYQEARRILLREALVHLDRKRSRSRDQGGIYSELIGSYQRRLDALPAKREEPVHGVVDHASRQEAVLSVLQVERETLIRLRDEGRIDDEVMRTLQRELDLTESRMHSGSLLLH